MSRRRGIFWVRPWLLMRHVCGQCERLMVELEQEGVGSFML